jgi:hypothetical protein
MSEILPALTAPPVSIVGPGGTYTLIGLLAAGDVADVHRADAGMEWSYVLKVARAASGNALLDNESLVLTRLLARAGESTYRKYLPDLISSFWTEDGPRLRVNVFRDQPGLYTLERVHERHPALEGRHLAWVFKRLLTVLGFSHRQGAVHGAVLPCHVLLDVVGHGARLVGWGQSVAPGRPLAAIVSRYRDWYPPEVLNQRPASPGTDLFLAARCLIYLAGGDPVRNRMPDAVPAPLRRFVASCLLEGPTMRPRDAWALLDELDALLRRLYGAPEYVPLEMS